jgi:optic atrophy protein 1
VKKGCQQLPVPIPYKSKTYGLLIPLKQGVMISQREISHSVLHRIVKPDSVLLRVNPPFQQTIPSRGYAMVVARILRGVLKIRYVILGGALGGGVTLQKVTNYI